MITPSYNSAPFIERAIQSVLAQDYEDFEHIVVDGGSTDGTLEILKRYTHLKWVSKSGDDQVHAMNNGFDMASGDIIVNLYAQDQFLQGAFSSVSPHFDEGEEVVVGKVVVHSQKPDGIYEWINDPKTDFASVIRHWEPNTFCVNPLGYFYRREVRVKVPFREDSGSNHDLGFYIEVSLRFRLKKIDEILGVFNHTYNTQAAPNQLFPDYWQPEHFSFLTRFCESLPENERRAYQLAQERGYQLQRRLAAIRAFDLGFAKYLFDSGEVVLLPQDEDECAASRCGFVEHDQIGNRGDWIIPVLTMGKVASKAICATLKTLPPQVLPAEVYHVHQMNLETLTAQLPQCLSAACHQPVGLALKTLYDQKKNYFKWKIVTGVRDPISLALAGAFEIWGDKVKLIDHPQAIFTVLEYCLTYFDEQYQDSLGIDLFEYDFDRQKRYSIVTANDVEILLYRFEDLPEVFPEAIERFLGIPDLELRRVNVAADKPYASQYDQMKRHLRVDKRVLDKVYSSRLATHFYTEKEIDAFYRSWVGRNEVLL